MLRRISVGFLLICILSGILPAQAEVERNAYLDVAFTCLEEGNPFFMTDLEKRWEIWYPLRKRKEDHHG